MGTSIRGDKITVGDYIPYRDFVGVGHLHANIIIENTDWRVPMRMNRLVPMLPVKNMPASIEFYQKLGFSVEQRNDNWGWAMLRFDECHLMVDQSINLHVNSPRQSVLYLYPENIKEYHEQLRRSGLKVPDLDTTFYGMIEFRLEDPDDNRLWIGQNTSTVK